MAAEASFRMGSFAPSTSSSSSSTPLLRLSHQPSRIRVTTTTTRARLTFTLKCDLTSDSDSLPIRHAAAGSNASTISALQLLKTSAAANRYTKERSGIIVIGLNVHTAPVDIREKLSIPEPQWAQAITDLCALPHIEEAAVLSTCNRIEIYVVALSQHRGVKEVTEWMSKISGVPVPDLCQHRFLLYNNQATQHLFEVSSGLDSLVLGEGQILSQVKQVVKSGQGVPGFARKISGLFKHAITVGKRVRTETNISTGSVSVSSAAVDLALIKLLPQSSSSSFANSRVMVVGAGKMGKLVIKHLIAKGCTRMVVVNRTEDKVAAILKQVEEDGVDIIYRPFSEIIKTAAESDVIFTCTASEVSLFTNEQVQSLPRTTSGSGGRLFIDISVPRNVEPGVSSVEGVCLYNVDDLKEVVTANKEERSRKAMEAGMIIMNEVGEFEAWKDSLETVPTIKKLRAYAERIRSSEVDKCLSKMNDITKQQREAVHHLSLGIVNKLLHGPMQHLRCNAAGDDDRSLSEVLENMHALNRVFGLDTDVSDLEEKIRSKIERTKSQIKIDT